MLFTDPLWLMALFAGGAALFLCPYPVRTSRTNRMIALAAFGFAAANSATSFVRLDDDGASARKIFMSEKVAWRDVASVDIVHRRGKYSASDWLEIAGRDGETVDVQIDNLAPDRAAELAAFVAKRLPAQAAGADDMVHRLAPGRQLALGEDAPRR